ncbi:MAG TPA: hypothetical protein ENH55_13260 [Aurantimonas coralicida]|uniref:Uncharacterized protein n=1 Tax=Aurantimonas coralicida TaxID=182270 RepID=A0A9C9TFW5_9HYPH|nr:hypothetical protein [Aurantimonas coralicida]HET99671.1 hypothetical protein [Aurantimonas coralicida]
MKSPERKIAIFGTTPSRGLGPYADGSGWERWTIGPGGKDAHNWERLFEVHGLWPADFKGYLNDLSLIKPPQQVVTLPQPDRPAETWAEAIANWKATHGLPDDVLKGDWSGQVTYPRETILEKFGRRMWFSSSISWCIALAIHEKPTDIGLWGIDLEAGEEYISQFVGCAHFLDLARLCGINIHLPKDCGLLRDPAPYPDRWETHLALTLEKKAKWIDEMIQKQQPEYDALSAEVHRQEGKLLTMRAYEAEAKDIEEGERVLIANNARLGQIAANINQLKGELSATQFYRRMYVWGMVEPY